MSTVNRITGMVSGFDTDTLIKDLMKIEQARVDKAKQNKQLAIWQKDAYKEFSSLLRGLQSEFLDLLKPASNLRGKSMFNVFGASVSLGGVSSSAVTATTSANSVKGTITIDQISQLATRDTWSSGGGIKNLEGTAVDITELNAAIAAGNNTIKVTMNGTTRSIDLAGSYLTFRDGDPLTADLVSDLQSKLDAAFGPGKIIVGGTEPDNKLTLDASGSVLTVSSEDPDVLGKTGFVTGDSNVLSLSTTLASAFGIAEDPVFTINGVTSAAMGIKSTDTIRQMMDKINASGAGVTMSYSTITDKFTMQASKEGTVNNITLDDSADNFFRDKLGLSTAAGRTSGQDASLTINGVATTRSSNTFEVDGTTLTLKQTYTPATPETAADIQIDVSASTGDVVNTIKNFITKYNELIDKIMTKTAEKRYRDYLPLTDEQKEDMSEDDITLWETKAKSGLVRSDSSLRSIANQLRAAINDPVEGLGITLRDIGITMSPNYKDNGKLVLDEAKLNTALTDRPNEVISLFSNESATTYSDSANRAIRYSQNGWANRINDIIQDNIRLSRNASGQKGILIEKAGYEVDGSETSSLLAKKIASMEDGIAKLLEDIADKEDRYYAQFARMESALNKMNSQFTSVFGTQSGTS